MLFLSKIFQETFSSHKLKLFERLILIILILSVVEEVVASAQNFYTGMYYPRYLFLSPIQNIFVPYLQWGVIVGLSLWALIRSKLWMLRLLCVVFFISTLQVFSNHKLLLWLNLLFLSLDQLPKGDSTHSPAHVLIKMQLCLVYWLASLHKISLNFMSGDSLGNLFLNLAYPPVDHRALKILSVTVVGFQMLLPFLLKKMPKPAFVLLILFHVGMSFFIPGLWVFTFTMIAMGFLYV